MSIPHLQSPNQPTQCPHSPHRMNFTACKVHFTLTKPILPLATSTSPSQNQFYHLQNRFYHSQHPFLATIAYFTIKYAYRTTTINIIYILCSAYISLYDSKTPELTTECLAELDNLLAHRSEFDKKMEESQTSTESKNAALNELSKG